MGACHPTASNTSALSVEKMNGFPSEDGRYWVVIEVEENGKRKVVGNCWFGNRSWDEDYAKNESWGFGYNVIRSDDKDLDNQEYTIEELEARDDADVNTILYMTDYLIEGRYVQELRDTTLPLRGSSNQRIIKMEDYWRGK